MYFTTYSSVSSHNRPRAVLARFVRNRNRREIAVSLRDVGVVIYDNTTDNISVFLVHVLLFYMIIRYCPSVFRGAGTRPGVPWNSELLIRRRLVRPKPFEKYSKNKGRPFIFRKRQLLVQLFRVFFLIQQSFAVYPCVQRTISAIIVDPASCGSRAEIRFSCAKRSSAAEIHRELCLVYGSAVMSEGNVRQCRGTFVCIAFVLADRFSVFVQQVERLDDYLNYKIIK